MRLRAGLIVAATVALTGFSCSERGGKNINEGEINYTIQYFGSMGSFKDLMPKTLIVSFKDNKILFDISAPIGNSGIMNLSKSRRGHFRYLYQPPVMEILLSCKIRRDTTWL